MRISNNTVRLVVSNTQTIIRGEFPRDMIDEETSFMREGYFHIPQYKSGRWDGKIHLLKKNTFPTGLLFKVEEILKKHNRHYTIIDERATITSLKSFALKGIKLRDYQISTIASMLLNMRGIVQIPTGGGKTLIAAATIKALNCPTAFIVHTSTLLEQTKDVFIDVFGKNKVGIVGGGMQDYRDITIFMVQTLHSQIKKGLTAKLKEFQALFIDEAHHVSGHSGAKTTWYRAQQYFTNASARFGLTATPVLAKHGLLLESATGRIIYKISLTKLQADGFVSAANIKFIELTDGFMQLDEIVRDPLAPPSKQDGLLLEKKAYRIGIVSNELRNNIAVAEAIRYANDGKLILIFVELRKHGKFVEDILKRSDFTGRFHFLCGLDKREFISAVKKDAKNKKVQILVVTRKLFGEGVDIPAIDVLINLAGGKSLIAFAQMFGRGLRISKGKDKLHYIDFFDGNNVYLKRHSNARITHCRKLGQEVSKVRVDMELCNL